MIILNNVICHNIGPTCTYYKVINLINRNSVTSFSRMPKVTNSFLKLDNVVELLRSSFNNFRSLIS